MNTNMPHIAKPSQIVIDFIKATTAYGGDDYFKYSRFYNAKAAMDFEDWLEAQPAVEGIELYRGYTFNEGYWNDCNVFEGRTLGADQLTQSLDLPAFTDQPLRAVRYMNDFGEIGLDNAVRVLFIIRTQGKYFVDISSLSIYPSEHEYRCKINTFLRVEKVENKGAYIEVICNEI